MPLKQESAATPAKAETRLTFGIELEFVLATSLKVNNSHPHPQDHRQLDAEEFFEEELINLDILEKLKAVGIPAVTPSMMIPRDQDYNTFWILKKDCSVGMEGINTEEWDMRYDKNGMEMASPPYYYTEAAGSTIRSVLKVVRDNYLVRVDDSTGLHVHVGNSYHGLQFPIVRNLLAIAFTYEAQLLLILPADRASSTYCPPLSASKFCMSNPDLTRAEALEMILKYTDNASLLADFGKWNSSRLAFNLEGLRTPYKKNGKRTIEFRHHPGSLDADAILNWVHVCVKFVEKACFAKDEELFARLREDISKPIGLGDGQLGPIDFLMWIGCPAQAYYYCSGTTTNPKELEDRIAQSTAQHESQLDEPNELEDRIAQSTAQYESQLDEPNELSCRVA